MRIVKQERMMYEEMLYFCMQKVEIRQTLYIFIMDKKERMQQVVRWLIYNGVAETQKGIAMKAGYNVTVFSSVMSGAATMSTKFIQKVCALDRRLRPEWVISGEGEMLRERRSTGNKGRLETTPYYRELPVSAGEQDAPPYNDQADEVYIPGVKAEAFFPVTGCSMMPTIGPGDMVGVVPVDRLDRVDPEGIYMVITRENERMIKHIQPTPESDPDIVLLSDNPNYAPFRRAKEDILKVFRVVYVGRMV